VKTNLKVVLLPVIVLIFLAVLWFGPQIPHDISLWRFKRSFLMLRHPANSALIKQFSAVGLLEGNGDHCDYLAVQFRETDQSPEEVLLYYSNLRVPRVDPSYETGFENQVPVHIGFPDRQRSDIDHLINSKMFVAVRSKQSRKTLYLIYSIDAGYPPSFDLRCY
jgi:hypothetical protein